MTSARPRWAVSRYALTSLRSANPLFTMYQPSAPWAAARRGSSNKRSRWADRMRRLRRRKKYGMTSTSPTARAMAWVGRTPPGAGGGGQDARYGPPLRDRQPALSEAGDAADRHGERYC